MAHGTADKQTTVADRDATQIRVAVIIAETRATGLVRQLLETLTRLDGEKCAVRITIVARHGVDVEQISSEARYRGLDYEVMREASAWDPSLIGRLNDRLRSWSPDLVQTHGHKPNVLGFLAHRRFGLPWVAFYHGRTTTDSRVRLYHRLNRHVMSCAPQIVAVADGVQSHLRKRDRGRVRVIENAVVNRTARMVSRNEDRHRLGLQSYERAVGFIGRLSDEKGPDLFLEAFAILRSELPEARAFIVGDGPLRMALGRTVARSGLEDSVRFCGFVEEMDAVYSALDIVVISSRSEVFPNVLLEAVSAGVPVVAARVGGIPNIVAGLESVTLVDAADARGLASSIKSALDSRSDAAIDRARARVGERYSQERRAAEFLDLYRELLRDR